MSTKSSRKAWQETIERLPDPAKKPAPVAGGVRLGCGNSRRPDLLNRTQIDLCPSAGLAVLLRNATTDRSLPFAPAFLAPLFPVIILRQAGAKIHFTHINRRWIAVSIQVHLFDQCNMPIITQIKDGNITLGDMSVLPVIQERNFRLVFGNGKSRNPGLDIVHAISAPIHPVVTNAPGAAFFCLNKN
jgi:hypothetical protein